eukprot:gene10144-biopygen5946
MSSFDFLGDARGDAGALEAGFEVVLGRVVVLVVVLVVEVAVLEDVGAVAGELAHVARRDPDRGLVGGGADIAPVGLDDVFVRPDDFLELRRRVAEEIALVWAAGEGVGEGEGDGQADGRQREEGDGAPQDGAHCATKQRAATRSTGLHRRCEISQSSGPGGVKSDEEKGVPSAFPTSSSRRIS